MSVKTWQAVDNESGGSESERSLLRSQRCDDRTGFRDVPWGREWKGGVVSQSPRAVNSVLRLFWEFFGFGQKKNEPPEQHRELQLSPHFSRFVTEFARIQIADSRSTAQTGVIKASIDSDELRGKTPLRHCAFA